MENTTPIQRTWHPFREECDITMKDVIAFETLQETWDTPIGTVLVLGSPGDMEITEAMKEFFYNPEHHAALLDA